MKNKQERRYQHSVKVRITEFGVPPIHDGLVLGKASPIGSVAIRRSMELLAAHTFEHMEVKDDVISDMIVRAAILKRMPREKLLAFVVDRIKPLMRPEEILHLDLEVEVTLEQEL